MEPSLLSQGLELMLAGMGTVFVFLTLLVGATRLMSSVALKFAPPAPPLVATPQRLPGQPTPEEVAAITAAITVHRKNR